MAKDEDQQKQSKGLREIYMETLKIIAANRKTFILATASMILPALCLFLAQWLLIIAELAASNDPIIAVWVTNTIFCISILLFMLLSSSSVVFTFACVYASPSNEISFRKVMAAAPRIWRDLIHTFVYLLIAFGIYSIFFLAIQLIFRFVISKTTFECAIDPIELSIWVLQDFHLCLIGAVWQLASVVTILEGIGGNEALQRSIELMKGNMRGAAMDFSCLVLCLYGIADLVFGWGLVEDLGAGKISWKIAIGGSFVLLFFMLVVPFMLVKNICVYIACKEIVDKQLLARRLEVYFGDYVPLINAEAGLSGGGAEGGLSGGDGCEGQMEDIVVVH